MKYQEIKSWEKVCEALGRDPKKLPIVSHLEEQDQKWPVDHYILVKAIEAVNGEYEPDFLDWNQAKWVLWPDIIKDDKHPSGLGFSYCADVYSITNTYVGARLSVESQAKLKHLYKYFGEYYRSYFFKEIRFLKGKK